MTTTMLRSLFPVGIAIFLATTVWAQAPGHQKVPIDPGTVKQATIEHAGEERTLATSVIADFVRIWGAAAKPTADKYRWDYELTLVLDGGGTRRFHIQGNRIQESGDWSTWHVESDTYGARLWDLCR